MPELKTDPNVPSRDWKGAVEAFFLDAVNVVAIDPAKFSLGVNVGAIITGIYKAGKTFDERLVSDAQGAHIFWRSVLVLAVMKAIRDNDLLDLEENREILTQKAKDFCAVMESAAEFGPEELQNPTAFAPYKSLRSVFCQVMQDAGVANHSQEQLARLLDKALEEALWQTFLHDKSKGFRAYIQSILQSLVFEGHHWRLVLEAHYAWIEKKLKVDPLFGQEKTGIKPEQVYVPLRCNQLHEIEGEGDDETSHHDKGRKMKRAHVGWLKQEAEGWLSTCLQRAESNRRVADSLRFVSGGPGSGKSLFSRVFASEQARRGEVSVAYVELQHFIFKDDLKAAIANYFKSKQIGRGLGVDIFSMQNLPSAKPILFVFDGLDELSHKQEVETKVAKDFVRNLKDFLATENTDVFAASALVLGRDASITAARDEVAMDECRCFKVMPLKPLDADVLEVDCLDDDEDWEKFTTGDRELIKADHRETFWHKWLEVSGKTESEQGTALDREELDSFTAEPLLFYLLILSEFADERLDEASENLNVVYKKIFQDIFKRDRADENLGKDMDHQAGRKLKETEFFALMECLGLAIWQGGGRTSSAEDFANYLSNFASKLKRDLEKVRGNDVEPQDLLDNAAVQTYARNTGDDGKGYEFVHKSFGEYLSARALIDKAIKLSGREPSEEEFCISWQGLFSKQQITPEILGFMKREVRFLKADEVEDLLEFLTDIMNWVLKNGFPAHRLEKLSSWTALAAHQRNATGSLLAVLSALAISEKRSEKTPVPLKWRDEHHARDFIEMLHITQGSAHGLCLAGLDFTNNGVLKPNLMTMNLHNAVLDGAQLEGAQLNWAQLNWAWLIGAQLEGVQLEGAQLDGAQLIGAWLIGARLDGAQLGRARLDGARLIGAQLDGAQLDGAQLNLASVKDTSLKSVSLTDASLQKIIGLTQDQLESTFATGPMELPENLKRPAHWGEETVSRKDSYQEWQAWKLQHMKKQTEEA